MKEYDKTKPMKYILYLDMNNLYGFIMTKALPCGEFKNSSQETIDYVFNNINKDLFNWGNDDSDKGVMCGVDLEIPKDKHDYFRDFPLAAVHRNGKLCLTLEDEFNYGIHIANLKYFISKGLILKKIHWMIEFKQKPWMKSYIDLNTEKRREASIKMNKFEEDYFKLMNNAVFGKTMENIRKRQNI